MEKKIISEGIILITAYPKRMLLLSIFIASPFIIFALFSRDSNFAFAIIILLGISTWIMEMIGGVSVILYGNALQFQYRARPFKKKFRYEFSLIEKILITTSDKYQATDDFRIFTIDGNMKRHDFFFSSVKEIQKLINKLREMGVTVEIKSIGTVFFK